MRDVGDGGTDDAMSECFAELTNEPLDAAAHAQAAQSPRAGAVATFVGTVRAERGPEGRELAALEYTAYEPMALRQMRRIVEEVAAQHDTQAVRAAHRLGVLRVGEASVIVVVSAPHRAAAFDACRAVIERLKTDVPIFKQEHWTDGGRSWVASV